MILLAAKHTRVWFQLLFWTKTSSTDNRVLTLLPSNQTRWENISISFLLHICTFLKITKHNVIFIFYDMGLLLLLLLLLLVLHSNIASFNKSWVTFFLFNVTLKILAYFTVEKKKKSGCGLKSERKTKKGEQFELSWVGVWGGLGVG